MKALAAVLGSWIVLAAGPASAMEDFTDYNCLSQSYLKYYLERAFDENRVAQGDLDNGNPVELYASRTGTWTLIELRPDGKGCVHASGTRLKIERSNLVRRSRAEGTYTVERERGHADATMRR